MEIELEMQNLMPNLLSFTIMNVKVVFFCLSGLLENVF